MSTVKHIKEHQLLGVPSSKGTPFLMVKMSTSERDVFTATGQVKNGMVIYNTTTDKFQGYAGGLWVNLH